MARIRSELTNSPSEPAARPDGPTPAGVAYAHSLPDKPEDRWEPLERHLEEVAELAERFGAAFASGAWTRLAGLWHDLGKYRPEFQARLRGSREHVEHAGVGAALAESKGAVPLAFAIAGHHAGLANYQAQGDSALLALRTRLDENRPRLGAVLPLVPRAIREAAVPRFPPFLVRPDADPSRAKRRWEFWIRMVFSGLVDADFLATERFYDESAPALRSAGDPIPVLRARLDGYLSRFRPDTEVNRLRHAVLRDCRQAAQEPPGLFSLSVPTGGGKTLSSLAFALAHAERYGLRRVIVVIPYTSIIEQTARVYRTALGDANVVEHHSNLDAAERLEQQGETELRRRLAAENWDAPVIVTTNVQFFESLFANRPSRCRKLHNVVRSVIVLDEAQALPTGFLLPVLDAIRTLSQDYGCTLVLSTATQPALDRRNGLPQGLEGVREIVSEPATLARALERVTIRWPARDSEPESYEALAHELADEPRVLVVVHRRRDARELATLLPAEGRFHLSASMCAAHRLETLDGIRARLDAGGACRVVATQLVEAGVDLDFPVVYRAMAGLDSIAQAAGRCNREGLLSGADGRPVPGSVRVFRAPTLPPAGVLRRGLEVGEALLARYGERLSITDGDVMDEYFRMLYAGCELDARGIQGSREQLDFATVADRFRLIEDGYSHPIVVPWGDAAERIARFAAHPSLETQRALQPFIVQVHHQDLKRLESLGAVEWLQERVHVLTPAYAKLYDPDFGLVIAEDAADPAALIA